MRMFRKAKREPETRFHYVPDHDFRSGGVQDSTVYWGSGNTSPVPGEGWSCCSCGFEHGTEEAPRTGWQSELQRHLEQVGVIRYG